MPLPNSFARLLAHKLADYYNLLHVVGGDSNSVVVYKSDQSRLYAVLEIRHVGKNSLTYL